MSDKKNYLGWGLVGAPNGRQYTSDGVDKQLNQAKIFELEQMIGGCLPDPKLGDFTALYVLRQRNINKTSVLGFGEYLSISESGQGRSGSYFGSFIEAANVVFGLDSVSTIFNALRELSIYQTRHFIDIQKKEYHTSINNKPFDAPNEQLNQIAEQLQALPRNYFTQTPQGSSLFIHCDKGQAIEVAKALLAGGWFYRYQNIFFTENEHICHQIRGAKIEQLSSAQLFNSAIFSQSWQTEVNYLYAVLKNEQTERQKLREENHYLTTEQTRLVAQQVEQQAGQYKAELESAKQYLASTNQQLQEYESLAQFGKQVFDVAANNADRLGNSQLAQYTSVSPSHNEITSRLATLNNNILSLSQKIENEQYVSQMQEPQTKSPFTLLFAGLSLVFFIFAVAGWTSYVWDDSADKLKTEEDEVIKQLKQDKQNAEQEKENLGKQVKELHRKLEEKEAELNATKLGSGEGKNSKNKK